MTSATRPRALVLDDEPDTLDVLRDAFRKMPYETVFAARGIDALVEIFTGYRDQQPFDALVLDCALPYVDGFTIAKIVRMIEKTELVGRPTKIGFFTAYAETVEQSSLLQEVGADAYWRKPDDMFELPFLIASWLKVEVPRATSRKG